MSKSVLLVNSSPLGEHSISRKLTAKIIDKIREGLNKSTKTQSFREIVK